MIRPVSLILVLSFVASLSYAAGDVENQASRDNSSRQAESGFFGGAALGAAIGGPPGAIAVGIFGAILGEGWASKRQVDSLQTSLTDSRQALAVLQEENSSLRQRQRQQIAAQASRTITRQASSTSDRTPSTSCCDNTVMSVYFQSGSSAIEEHDRELITSFARLSNQTAHPVIEITGYADRNGNADSNLALSRQRSEQVKQYLAQLGIADSRITTVAYGESRPLRSTQKLETDFFDRRVILRLRDGNLARLSSTELAQ